MQIHLCVIAQEHSAFCAKSKKDWWRVPAARGLGKSARRRAGILPAGTSDYPLTLELVLSPYPLVDLCGPGRSARRRAGTSARRNVRLPADARICTFAIRGSWISADLAGPRAGARASCPQERPTTRWRQNLSFRHTRFVDLCGLGKSARRGAGILPAGMSDYPLTPEFVLSPYSVRGISADLW